jgi:hypothetical protein
VHTFLEFLEDLLIRMIKGVVRFTLIRIPIRIIQYLNRYFPTLIRLIRVLFWLMLWIAIGVLPIAALLYLDDSRIFSLWDNSNALPRYHHTSDLGAALWTELNRGTLLSLLSLAWLGVFATGSVWGPLFLVRRRRRERKQRRAERAAVPAEFNPMPQGRGRR